MDPLLGLEYHSTTPFSVLLADYLKRKTEKQNLSETESIDIFSRSMRILVRHELQDTVGTIENLTEEELGKMELPLGIRQLCTAVKRKGNLFACCT